MMMIMEVVIAVATRLMLVVSKNVITKKKEKMIKLLAHSNELH